MCCRSFSWPYWVSDFFSVSLTLYIPSVVGEIRIVIHGGRRHIEMLVELILHEYQSEFGLLLRWTGSAVHPESRHIRIWFDRESFSGTTMDRLIASGGSLDIQSVFGCEGEEPLVESWDVAVVGERGWHMCEFTLSIRNQKRPLRTPSPFRIFLAFCTRYHTSVGLMPISRAISSLLSSLKYLSLIT